MRKPKVYKADGKWHVSMPSYGFASQPASRAFPSHKAAISWLQSTEHLGTGSQLLERAGWNGQDDSGYSRPDNNRPMVIR